MSGVFDHIRLEAAEDSVSRLQRTDEHLAFVAPGIDEAISWGDLGPELAEARMLVGELLEEVPALAATIDLKVSAMLATDQGWSLYSMFEHWQAQAQANLEESLDDGFRAGGDAGGTYSVSYRGGFEIDATDPTRAGVDLVHELLLTTSSEALVAKDEFQLILLDNGSYVVVLPGVTDLSSPDLGLDDTNRTVRDLDRYAIESAAGTGIDGNEYARMVEQALLEAAVPFGADLAILGHSFGADTALDLAADPDFNGGPRGYNLTHVIAAGYHSGPQLEHVAGSTEVLVLQNHHDLAVLTESGGHRAGTVLYSDLPVATRIQTMPGALVLGAALPVAGALEDATGFVVGSIVNVGADAADLLGDEVDRLVVRHTGLGDGDLIPEIDVNVHINDFDDIFLIDDGVTRPRPGQVVDVFEGAWQGVGHHPANYAQHVATTDDQDVLGFFESLALAGYSGRMERWSVDISVPDER